MTCFRCGNRPAVEEGLCDECIPAFSSEWSGPILEHNLQVVAQESKRAKQYELELLSWNPTANRLVLQCEQTKKFHFVDESFLIDERPYDTYLECEAALSEYARSL